MSILTVLLVAFSTAVQAEDWLVHNYHRLSVYPVKDASDNIIYVTFSLDDDEAIQLAFQDGRKACVVPHHMTYNARNRYTVAVLGNGKIISMLRNSNILSRKSEWKLSIIDPNSCTYKHQVIGDNRQSFTRIFPYQDTFDLVAEERPFKRLVRYTDNGQLEGFSLRIHSLGAWRIAKEFDNRQGYYAVVANLGKQLSTIQKISKNFKVIAIYNIKHTRLAYDANSYSFTFARITFCYFDAQLKKTSLQCVVIDGNLTKELSRVRLSYEHEVTHTTVVNFKQGFAVVHVENHGNRVFTVYAQRVSATNRLGPIVRIGKVSDGLSEIHAFVMKDEKLCIVATAGGLALTKCIHLK